MLTRKALGILSSWLNYLLGNNIAIIICCGVIFQWKQSQLFYLHIYELVTQPLPLNLPFVNKTQDITGRYN